MWGRQAELAFGMWGSLVGRQGDPLQKGAAWDEMVLSWAQVVALASAVLREPEQPSPSCRPLLGAHLAIAGLRKEPRHPVATVGSYKTFCRTLA